MSSQIEIERKFLTQNEEWREHASAKILMMQGYLSQTSQYSVRVRIENQTGKLNIKQRIEGQLHTRNEFEYTIPLTEAKQLLEGIDPAQRIEKYRWPVMHAGKYWEVDEFRGSNSGLVVAEIELDHIKETFRAPSWLGEEITYDPKYYNVNLVKAPYEGWDLDR